MIRLWGQAQFSIKTKKLSGYELFLREQKLPGGPWRLPDNISLIDPAQMSALLNETLAAMPDGLEFVAFNLDQSQFVQPEYLQLLQDVKRTLPFKLGIELTERHGDDTKAVALADLITSAKAYQGAGLLVCLDDVGTGENVGDLVEALDPYVSEYKYAIQNVRKTQPQAQIAAEVTHWRKRARQLGKVFTLEGLELSDDLTLIRDFCPDFVQGYYFGTPHFMAIPRDLTAG